MSKKIAQLTKVIFHLNSKVEDNQDDLEGLASAYETEIDLILKDCADKVGKFRDKLEAKKAVEKEQLAVNELVKQHEAEKKAALDEFGEFKKTAERKINASKSQVDGMTQEMEKMKVETKNPSP